MTQNLNLTGFPVEMKTRDGTKALIYALNPSRTGYVGIWLNNYGDGEERWLATDWELDGRYYSTGDISDLDLVKPFAVECPDKINRIKALRDASRATDGTRLGIGLAKHVIEAEALAQALLRATPDDLPVLQDYVRLHGLDVTPTDNLIYR